MKNKILFVFFLILICSPFISAATTDNNDITLGTYRINSAVEVPQVCSNATSLCDLCNITSIKYPNSTIIVSNVEMTKRTYDFNYTLYPNQTGELGTYLVNGFCKSGNEVKVFSYDFQITRTGELLSTSQAIVYIVVLIGILPIFLLCLLGAIKLRWKNQRDEMGYIISVNDLKYVKLMLIVLCYILLLWMFGILRAMTGNYLELNAASNLFYYLYWIMLAFMWPIIVVSVILGFIMWVESKKIKKILNRGVPFR